MPALHELNQGFEEAPDDKEFLDEFAYYCKHYIGRLSFIFCRKSKTIRRCPYIIKQEHLNHTGSHKITVICFRYYLQKETIKFNL